MILSGITQLIPVRWGKLEFKKTAAACEEEPWCLHAAAAYLRELVSTDGSTAGMQPYDLGHIIKHRITERALEGPKVEGCLYSDFAPEPVRVVSVSKATPGMLAKRRHETQTPPGLAEGAVARGSAPPKATDVMPAQDDNDDNQPVYTYMSTCIYMYIYMYICMCISIYIYVYVCIHVYIHVYIYVCGYTYTCVLICISI